MSLILSRFKNNEGVLKMKKANTIIALVAIAGFSFAATLSNGMNLNKDMKLSMNTAEDVYGVQFDMRYNPEHINVEELSNANSLVNGVDIHSQIKEPGFMRVIMFSMNLDKISSANEISDIIDFNITPSEGHAGNTTINFDNIIVAGNNGQQLEHTDSFVYELTSDVLVPSTTELSNAYPNPFNPSTNIAYNLGTSSDVSLVIYDMKGSIVKTLVSEFQDAGERNVIWNGNNDSGSQVSSGMYLVRLEASGQVYQQAITLLK